MLKVHLLEKIVRPHPGSHFRLIENHGYEIDNNNLSIIDFLKKCRKILTINSSVGLEAMLMNIPVKILGIVLMHFVMLMMLMSELNV